MNPLAKMRAAIVILAAALAVAAYAAPTAAAEPPTWHENTFVFIVEPGGCFTETIVVTAVQHVIVQDFVDAAGHAHVHVAGQHHSVEAIGLDTGARYISQGVSNITFIGSTIEEDSASHFMETATSRLIRVGETGSPDDYLAHYSRRFVVNGNGEFVTSHEELTVTCR